MPHPATPSCESPLANHNARLVLTKSVTPERVVQNFTLVDLSQEELDELKSIEKESSFRACYPWWTGWGDLGFPDCRASGPPRK